MVQILTSSRNGADAGAVSLSMLLYRPSGLPLRFPLSDSCDRGIGGRSPGHWHSSNGCSSLPARTRFQMS
jgi:hypothetical protein